MDIVHLIETKMVKSTQEDTSHTYAEIERTIALDHSEGIVYYQAKWKCPMFTVMRQ